LLASLLDPLALGDGHRHVANPMGIPGAHDLMVTLNNLTRTSGLLGLGGTGLVAVVLRYRRSAPGSDLREQLKWFMAGASTLLVALLVANQVSPSGNNNSWSTAGDIAGAIGFAAPAMAIGIAVLKYRLYDIDVVISRALVYGALADPETTGRGSGLQNMADRLDALGGNLEIESAPGGGTRVIGNMPARAKPG
jgi:hypothetical protein